MVVLPARGDNHGMEQPISFVADRHGRSIAYALTGQGRPLICDTGLVSHLDVQWGFPPYRRFFQTLALSHQVIRYDPPGIGLGDPAGHVLEFEDDVAVFEDLVDGLGLATFDAFGASQAGPVMIAYAARHPERVGRLIVFGTYADGSALCPDDLKDAFVQLVRANWGIASRTMADIWVSGADESVRAWFSDMVRASASAEAGARRFAECYRTDVRDLLPTVRTPTLVLHRQDDRCIRFELGREVAAGITAARFVPLQGAAHLFYVGDVDSVLVPIMDFLGDPRRPPKGELALSARERQVAVLIRNGLSNLEIAAWLGVAQRTAEAHAEHIRTKLGFRSRSQIAAWAAQNLAGDIPPAADSGLGRRTR